MAETVNEGEVACLLMPLRLLRHRGQLPEPLGPLHCSSFPHKPILCADCEVLRGQGGVRLSRRPWEVGPVARPVRGVLQEGIPRPRFPQLESVTVTEPVGLTSIMMEKGCG